MNHPLIPTPQRPDRDDWRERAICQGREDEFLSDIAAVRARAAIECRSCPVRDSCLIEAKANGERFGIWGGQDFTPMPTNTRLPRCETCFALMRPRGETAEGWPGTVVRESWSRCQDCARKARAERTADEEAEAERIAMRREVLLGLR